jgi:hypothetical protein|tara:strand:+ start:854 stop:1066 length:213 start_codon:yes stop_codon:yes gene_type:complete
MEINENICVCDECKLPSDFGGEVANSIDETGGYIIYLHGDYYADDDTYMCSVCIEKNEWFVNKWFWGETA